MVRVALFLAALALAACSQAQDEISSPRLTHSVFFELKNDDEASVQALVDACYEFLEPHDGIVFFAVGPRHKDYQRDVNDLSFDVALTIVFEDTEAQDAYQVTEPHMEFIETYKDNWESVRVFDSLAPAGR